MCRLRSPRGVPELREIFSEKVFRDFFFAAGNEERRPAGDNRLFLGIGIPKFCKIKEFP
jgi:hypothetical protein